MKIWIEVRPPYFNPAGKCVHKLKILGVEHKYAITFETAISLHPSAISGSIKVYFPADTGCFCHGQKQQSGSAKHYAVPGTWAGEYYYSPDSRKL
jgi:hypothetical protein